MKIQRTRMWLFPIIAFTGIVVFFVGQLGMSTW